MKFYRATKNGITYHATIMYSPLGSCYAVQVDARIPYGQWYRDWNGKNYGGYVTEQAAMRALRRHYPGMEWMES